MIELIDVYKIYNLGDENIINAIDGITLHIDKGEFVAIEGQSGSGKSTLMNIIGCLDVPTKGEYILDGRSVGEMTDNELAEIRNKKIGFVFQNFNLIQKLNAFENVELSMIYSGIKKDERIDRTEEALRSVELLDRMYHRPNQLSGGQQQRVAIARALASRPSVILADEPTGALDSHSGAEILGILRELHAKGNTVIMITHDNGIAQQADRIVKLQDGKLIWDKSVIKTSGKMSIP